MLLNVLFTFLASFAETPLDLEKNCMSDNIRNNAIFEIKIAKIAQNLPKFDILHIWLERCTMRMFLLTLQTNSGVSIFYSYRDLAWIKHKSKKCFFCQNFQNFWQNWILIFRCTTSVGMLFFDFLQIFCTKDSWRYGSDKESVTDKRTDGRTYTEGKTIYISRRGRHIIMNPF